MSFVDREVPINCPHCHQRLQVAMIDEFKVAGCEKCHGILLQTRNFADLVKSGRAEFQGVEGAAGELDQASLTYGRDCPACGSRMDTHPYYGPGNVVIDSCLECHLVWLDHSELFQIIRAPGHRDRIA